VTIQENVRTELKRPQPSLLRGVSLFLDLDGTLLELIDEPDQVKADERLTNLIGRLSDWLDGRLAIVSGRSIDQIDRILGPTGERLALSGSHGNEHRWNGVLAQPARPAALDDVAQRLRAFAEARPGTLVEEKSYGVAFHYRTAPATESEVLAFALKLAADHSLELQEGKMMVELRVGRGNKGTAIKRLMARAPMAGTAPVFVGDDLTDEPGFQICRELGGSGILVGQPRPTAASYCLPDPRAVREWLEEAVA
jgi:trehalose 6-phosphate phosphatase